MEMIERFNFLVSCPHQSASEPRDGEQHPAILGSGDQHRFPVAKYFRRKNYVHTLTEPYALGNARCRHLTDRVRVRTCGIHETARVDHEIPARKLVCDYRRGKLSFGIFFKRNNARIVQRFAAGLCESLDQRDVVACVIKLTVGIHYSSHQATRRKSVHSLKMLSARYENPWREPTPACHSVIQFQADREVSGVDPAIARSKEQSRIRQERGVLQHMNTLVESLFEDAIFFEIEIANCFLQVSHASMDHLRGCAGSAARKVLSFELHRLQTAKLRIQCAAGPGCASSDHANIEAFSLNRSQGFLASFHAPAFPRRCAMGFGDPGKGPSSQIIVSNDWVTGEIIIAFIEERAGAAQEAGRKRSGTSARIASAYSLRPSFQAQTFPQRHSLVTPLSECNRATRVLRAEAIRALAPVPNSLRHSLENRAEGAPSINRGCVAQSSTKPPPYRRAGTAWDRPSCNRIEEFHTP